MKTYCKGVDITDFEFVRKHVYDYLKGVKGRRAKWHRSDYQKFIALLCNETRSAVRKAVIIKDTEKLDRYVDTITNEIIRQINNDRLDLEPIFYFNRQDPVNGKIRRICHESPLQQVMDYVTVQALMPLFKAKISVHQCASIPGRGQVYAKQIIEKWVRRDKDATYYEKIDVVKCYENIKRETILKLLKRDIHKNPRLLRFIELLLLTYQNGALEIGTYLSAWLCNYALSYAFRYAGTLCFYRREKRIKSVKHMLFYMDDMLFVGSNKKGLRSAVNEVTEYLKKFLKLEIHDGVIYKTRNHPIDMVGYVIAYKYTKIRKVIFLRARRCLIRAANWLKHHKYLNLKRSYTCVSYYGHFKHSNSEKIRKKLSIDHIVALAKQTVSHYAKKGMAYGM